VRVVLTRPPGRATALARRLQAAGHDVALVPLTDVRDVGTFPDPGNFDGVLFTSASAAERAPAAARWPRVGAVGAATAAALRERGIRVDVVGDGGGAALARAWGRADGQRLLLPQAAEPHRALERALRAAGADVVTVPVYATSALAPDAPGRAALESADVIALFAPSAVRALVASGVQTRGRWWAVGATTAEAIAAAGREPLQGDLEALEDLG